MHASRINVIGSMQQHRATDRPPGIPCGALTLWLTWIQAGVTHLDTSDIYGPFTNEVLVGARLVSCSQQNACFSENLCCSAWLHPLFQYTERGECLLDACLHARSVCSCR